VPAVGCSAHSWEQLRSLVPPLLYSLFSFLTSFLRPSSFRSCASKFLKLLGQEPDAWSVGLTCTRQRERRLNAP
jgi:hypothetical protein